MPKGVYPRQPREKRTDRAKLLDSFGGRAEEDVLKDKTGEFFIMKDWRGRDIKYYFKKCS